MIAVLAAAALAAAVPDTVVALQNAGVAAARAGNLDLAVERLEEAHRLAPDEPTVRANLAEALLGLADRRRLEGDLEEAVRALDRSVRLRPDHAPARRLLGRTLYDLDEFAGAALHLRRALELAPDSRTAALLDRAETDAAAFAAGVPIPAARFRVVAPPDRLPAVQAALGDLERSADAAERAVGRPPRRPVSVLVYAAGDFGRSGAPEWAAGFYDGKVRLRAEDLGSHAALRRVAAHEFAHAILEQAAPGRFPVWLHEGIAILAEEEARDPFAPAPPAGQARSTARAALRDGRWVALADLEKAFRAAAARAAEPTARTDPFDEPPDVALLYAEAEVFVRHVRDSFGPGALADLVAAVADGADALAALERSTLRSAEEIDEEVRRSL